MLSALKWKCHGAARAEAGGSSTLQTRADRAVFGWDHLRDAPRHQQNKATIAGEGKDYPGLQVVK